MTVDSFKYLSVASAAIIKSMIARAPKEAIPWAPLRRPLREATVTLVSTAGISAVPVMQVTTAPS